MFEYRCPSKDCNALVCKGVGNFEAELICPKCKKICYVGNFAEYGLRGANFQKWADETRCKKCNRIFMYLSGQGEVEVECRKCSSINKYSVLKSLL